MARVRKTKGLNKLIKSKLENKRKDVSDFSAAEFVTQLGKLMPVEDGHGHEALLSASSKLGLPETQKAGQQQSSKASGDKVAQARGEGSVKHNPDKSKVNLQLNLPFLHKMEFGVPIRPISPGGVKANPVDRDAGQVGPLYGKRVSEGEGWLAIGTGESTQFKKKHTPKSTGFFKKAVKAVKQKFKNKRSN